MNKEHGQFKYLTEQQKKKDLYTGKYITDEKSDHYKFMLEHIFKGECAVYDSNIVTSWMFKLVADKYAQYVSNPCWDIKYNFYQNVVDITAMNKSIILLERNDKEELVWKYVKAEKHCKIDWDDYIFTIFKETDGILFKNDYTLIQKYYIEWWVQNIESKLYKWIHTWIVNSSDVPLTTIPQTRNIDAQINTWLPKALFVKERDEISKFDEIKRTVFSMDRLENMIDNELLSNIEKYTIINNVNPKNVDSAEDVLDSKTIINVARWKDAAPQASVEFVWNKNELVETAIEYLKEKKKEDISSKTSLPREFLWKDSTWNSTSTESRKMIFDDFVSKITSIRDLLDEQIYEIVEVLEWETKLIDYNYVWWQVLKSDPIKLLEELKLARECGWTTNENAIKRYMNITDPKELAKFIWLIKAENDNWINTDWDKTDTEETEE